MYTNNSALKLWTTVIDANVDLFHARAAFSAELFDLYTKWPRRSYGEFATSVKAAQAPVGKPAVVAASKPVSLPKFPSSKLTDLPVEPIVDLNEPGKAVPQNKA
jgi:hypothetical protein